jgi:superfamily II DNA/RNA helicase
VHVDIPQDHEDHPHRSGRTARAGEIDIDLTLAIPKQQKKSLIR